MFSKRTFWRKNKPKQNNWLEASDQGKETPFVAPIQTKLNIGKPGDVYEKEADATADEVVSKTGDQPQIQRMGEEQEEVQTKSIAGTLTPFVQKQEEKKEDIQSKEEKEVQMQEEEEAVQSKEEGEEEVQMKEEEEAVQKQEEEEAIQSKCDDCAEEEKSIQKQEEEEAVQSKE
ncbi:MAG: hypothetical protein P1U56_05510, partial [Saprospiraceae bacterium]|nr:hypothetical protein [Saprospiraceae bacterium]